MKFNLFLMAAMACLGASAEVTTKTWSMDAVYKRILADVRYGTGESFGGVWTVQEGEADTLSFAADFWAHGDASHRMVSGGKSGAQLQGSRAASDDSRLGYYVYSTTGTREETEVTQQGEITEAGRIELTGLKAGDNIGFYLVSPETVSVLGSFGNSIGLGYDVEFLSDGAVNAGGRQVVTSLGNARVYFSEWDGHPSLIPWPTSHGNAYGMAQFTDFRLESGSASTGAPAGAPLPGVFAALAMFGVCGVCVKRRKA